MLDALLGGIDGHVLHVQGTRGRLAHAGRVHDGEADEVASALQQQRVSEREAVDDLNFLGEIQAA